MNQDYALPLIAAFLVVVVLIAGCGDGGSSKLYARERALPDECKAGQLTLEQARDLIQYYAPGLPIVVEEGDRMEHNTRRDRVTGIVRIVFVRGEITKLAVAHELAHAQVFDAYSNKAPPGGPSTEKAVAVHGDEFVRAYKYFIAQLVSRECADAL